MKTRLCLLFLIILPLAHAADYYVSNSGNDQDSGISTGSPWQTIVKVNSMTFSPGDTISFNAGDVWRETLIVPSSGSSGNPITFTRYGSGSNPTIYRTEIFNSWELPGGDYTANNIYRGSIPGQICYNGMLNAAGNSRSIFYYARPSDLSTWEDGRFQGFYGSNGYFYLRSDSGPPGPREVGIRQFGIYTQDNDYIVIDGFDVIGPGGRDADSIDFWGDDGHILAKERASISIGPGSNHVTVKNCNVYYSNGVGVSKISSGDYAVIENITTDGCWSGIFLTGGDHHRISGCRVLNTGTIPEDAGDKDAIAATGPHKTDIIIEDTYVEKTCWQGAEQCDTAITFWLSGGGTIRRCHIKDAGMGGIGFGEIEGGAGMRIYNNIIEGWGAVGDLEVSYNAIKVGGASKTTNDYGDIYIDNNLFINGNNPPAFTMCDDLGWGDMGRCRTTLLVNHFNFGDVYIRNNIFYDNSGVYELFYNPESSTNLHIENNLFYSSESRDIISHYDGYAFFGEDGLQNPGDEPFNGFRSYISGNLFVNPLLVGPTTDNYHLLAGSPAIDAGIDVGLTQDHEGNPIVDTPDIGAYEYVQSYCTDGACDNNENCSTCPDDCGDCPIECIHDAEERPCDGCVDFTELIDYMDLWKSDSVEITELMAVVGLWKAGC